MHRAEWAFMTDKISLVPIGVIHSPFTGQKGTPVQPSMAGGAEGWAEVFPEYEEGLKDLEGFDRIWLIYWFDRAGPMKLLVTPYLDRETHGVFATRAPTRPNKIGLSSVKLVRRVGCRLMLADLETWFSPRGIYFVREPRTAFLTVVISRVSCKKTGFGIYFYLEKSCARSSTG